MLLNTYLERSLFADSGSDSYLFVYSQNCSKLSATAMCSLSQLSTLSSLNISCLDTPWQYPLDVGAMNDVLYSGYFRPRKNITEYAMAYDFRSLSKSGNAFDVVVSYNDTVQAVRSGGAPPSLLRVNKPINYVVQAFLRWYSGLPSVSATLDGIKEMPKPQSSLQLDFASLLGPLFYVWVVQLVFPTIVTSIVYEKEQKLRIMMKMMGLSDRAYWMITYSYNLVLYVFYIIIFVILGSIARLNIFRINDYGYVKLKVSFDAVEFNFCSTFSLSSTKYRSPSSGLLSLPQ
jgi:hypothetical protein